MIRMKKVAPRIITFSRRSDPAFHREIFLTAIVNGYIDVPNPFSGKPYRVSLSPEDIALLTFWTKDPSSVIPLADECQKRSIPVGFFITINGYPDYIELHTPPERRCAEAVKFLASRYSPEAIFWRYDPVIFTESITESWHINNFTRLCEIFKGQTHRVIFSLAHIDGSYAGARTRLESACAKADDPLDMPRSTDPAYLQHRSRAIALFAEMRQIASGFGIDHAEVCCSPKLSEEEQKIIPQGSCLSRFFLERIISIPEIPVRGTRKGSASQNIYGSCGCLESVDIGSKGSCKFGCAYCYANRNVRQ